MPTVSLLVKDVNSTKPVRKKVRCFTEKWKREAERIIQQNAPYWGAKGVWEKEVKTVCEAKTVRQIEWIRLCLLKYELEPNSRLRKYGRYWESEKYRKEALLNAWRKLGFEGSPPKKGFYLRKDGTPVLNMRKGGKAIRSLTHPFVTLSQAGLSSKPSGIPAVALIKWASREEYLYRIEDIQPHALRPLVKIEPLSLPRIRPDQRRKIVIHVGPTNSGKTHNALVKLSRAKSGLYLAPLRLMAWEAYERLNGMGCGCSLLTGEESIPVQGAKVIAATVEMLPRIESDIVVIDESQMIGDPSRGWAWARAIVLSGTGGEVYVCCAPEGLEFLQSLFTDWGDEVSVVPHKRMVPLVAEEGPVSLGNLPERSAVVAFSRTAVLRWKAAIENAHPGRRCAVIYGALPPDVRREQAKMVLAGEASYVATTDAIGMGLNLPIDHVFFAEAEKFDGQSRRYLTSSEIRQIAGRAGRYGMSSGCGTFGGLTKSVHKIIVEGYRHEPQPIKKGSWRPSYNDLLAWQPWRLAARIRAWQKSVVPILPKALSPKNLQEMLGLADLIPEHVERENPEIAFKLVTAPVSDRTKDYWLKVLQNGRTFQNPFECPKAIINDGSLEYAERSLHEHELCIWLARHDVFMDLDEPTFKRIRENRDHIARQIDTALKSGIALGTCSGCGKTLPPTYWYRLCNECYLKSERDFSSYF